jgi:hypothetical protein
MEKILESFISVLYVPYAPFLCSPETHFPGFPTSPRQMRRRATPAPGKWGAGLPLVKPLKQKLDLQKRRVQIVAGRDLFKTFSR